MTTALIFLIIVLVMVLVFTYTNGFHDAANAIATVVSTRCSRPGPALYHHPLLETDLGQTASSARPNSSAPPTWGVGVAKRFSSLNLVVIERIRWTWVFTIPATGLLAWSFVRLCQMLHWTP